MISCDFCHDVILLLTPITNISESYYLEIEKKIRTVDFDVIKMSTTATPVTDIKLHHLMWALSLRYISEQAALHISTYPLLELYYRVTDILVYSMIDIT